MSKEKFNVGDEVILDTESNGKGEISQMSDNAFHNLTINKVYIISEVYTGCFGDACVKLRGNIIGYYAKNFKWIIREQDNDFVKVLREGERMIEV